MAAWIVSYIILESDTTGTGRAPGTETGAVADMDPEMRTLVKLATGTETGTGADTGTAEATGAVWVTTTGPMEGSVMEGYVYISGFNSVSAGRGCGNGYGHGSGRGCGSGYGLGYWNECGHGRGCCNGRTPEDGRGRGNGRGYAAGSGDQDVSGNGTGYWTGTGRTGRALEDRED